MKHLTLTDEQGALVAAVIQSYIDSNDCTRDDDSADCEDCKVVLADNASLAEIIAKLL